MLRRVISSFRTTINVPIRGIEEFFPRNNVEKKTESLAYGSDWKAWMLRQKSTQDLHKLWYVLLKERNALLTEQADCRARKVQFPLPSRKIKVKKSMARIKFILHERSIIYQSNRSVGEESVQASSQHE